MRGEGDLRDSFDEENGGEHGPFSAGRGPTTSRRLTVMAAVGLGVLAGGLFLSALASPGSLTRSIGTAGTSGGAQTVIGQSVMGSPLTLIRFGTGARRLLVIGGVHGDEFGAAVADQLVTALQREPTLVPPGTMVDVIACLNPDGRATATRGNANGVDINRNMPTSDWSATLDKRDSSATRDLSGGTAPGSEPETRALLDALKNRYAVVISLHSSGGIVDFDGPGAEPLAVRLGVASGLPIGHLAYQPYIRGSMGAYLSWARTPLITVELTSPVLTDGLRGGMLASTQQD